MQFLFLALALPFALADDHPVPTPRPTITPAPESGCNYEDEANGPFALDCLQAQFLASGCSMRGDSYPNEVDENTAGDKSIYNAMTWTEVVAHMAAITSNVNACRGSPTPVPTPDPTGSPVTRQPTPAPTRIPTTQTPAPTYHEDDVYTVLVDSATAGYTDPADAATKIGEACRTAGYDRQYDGTQYVVKLTMGEFDDYFTFEPILETGGTYTSICEMLEDPAGNTPLWSHSVQGPWMTVDLESTTAKGPDGRVFPTWLDTRGLQSGQGYGVLASNDLTAVGNAPYTLSITSMRTFWDCVERVDQYNYVPPCGRAGNEGQDWSADPPMCDGSDDKDLLLYAMANMMIKTCDDRCIYHPDYVEGLDATTDEGQYWYWLSNSSGGCWKSRSEYTSGEFQDCDPTHASHLYGDSYAYLATRQERLCSERCDHANGWRFINGSCYKIIDQTMYADQSADNTFDQANQACGKMMPGGTLASIASPAENDIAMTMCAGICYLGNDYSKRGEGDGGWLDGTPLKYSNWQDGYEASTGTESGENYLAMTADGSWTYTLNSFGYNALCEAPADIDADMSNENYARHCMENGAASEVMQTNVFPELDIAASGFTDASAPGKLHLVVNIPKYFYNAKIAFENSTNDAAEYNWAYQNNLWTVNANGDPIADVAECENAMQLEGEVDWTVFNLGGAGGVQRLATWETAEDNGDRTVYDPKSDLAADGWENAKYMFGSVMRIEAYQPVYTSVDIDDVTFQKREALFERFVVARIPFILQFQKTITVTTDVDIVSTKFNFKTVAAIIQSIQYDTQFFEPPYAKVKLQIRTKSQYPYMFNKNVDTILLHPDPAATENNNVAMAIEHLHDDHNCTFTNPDHMREGDICTQEWMLYLTPDANVCYATGEYSIEYEAKCFYGKEVCYLPFDAQGETIDTVTFTFKVQTSKFCPTVADEVDLSGTLTVTGRESFKPAVEGVEDDTEGSFYLQGETIHLLAATYSEKAVITATKVVLVELEQDLSTLVLTGYNRVPYDDDILDLTVWAEDAPGRISDGTVTLNDGSGDIQVKLMEDSYVFASGHNFGAYTMEPNEAGFQIILHSKAFPVNVDSFGRKTLLATLAVEYEALSGLTRRRLLSTKREADFRSRAEFRLDSWKPADFDKRERDVATMALDLSFMQSVISRKNVRGFAAGFEDAVVSALKVEATGRLYDGQVVVEAVYSKGSKIYSRPTAGNLNVNRRKLQSDEQHIRVEFTMTSAPDNYVGAMSVRDMVKILHKQLKSPASPLMTQPLLYGSVMHSCKEVDASAYRMVDMKETKLTGDVLFVDEEESSAIRFVPVVLVSLLAALLF